MRHNVVIATHHKAGTVWMSTVFKSIARGLGVGHVDFWSHYDRLEPRLKPPFILFNHDSRFLRHAGVLRRDDVRILHLIRDPRDVLISALHYHRTAREPWLHTRTAGTDHRSYQDRLNSLATPLEQYLFELDNTTSSTIDAMLDWRYDRANGIEVRYEDLWSDRSMALWSRIVDSLGFEGGEQAVCRTSFWKHSLFGEAGRGERRHARSGEVAQWRHEFTPELARAFLDRFPDALLQLGYEDDDRWVDRLEPATTAEARRGVSRDGVATSGD